MIHSTFMLAPQIRFCSKNLVDIAEFLIFAATITHNIYINDE